LTDRIHHAYHKGYYERAHDDLESVRSLESLFFPDYCRELFRLRAWTQSRRGFIDGTAGLDELRASNGLSLLLITDYILVYRFRGLIPHPEVSDWIQEGLDFLRRHPDEDRHTIATFREHQGSVLMTEGHLQDARTLLEEICGPLREALNSRRLFCRATATLAETHRRLGDAATAQRMAEHARTGQVAHQYQGDLADFTLSCLAKLQTDPAQAESILAEALAIQTESQNRMGEARTLLLQARLIGDARHARPIKRRVEQLKAQVPALAQCPLLAKILDDWDPWTSGDLSPDASGDVFWGV